MNINWIFLWNSLVVFWPELVSGNCDKKLTLEQNSVTVRFVFLSDTYNVFRIYLNNNFFQCYNIVFKTCLINCACLFSGYFTMGSK